MRRWLGNSGADPGGSGTWRQVATANPVGENTTIAEAKRRVEANSSIGGDVPRMGSSEESVGGCVGDDECEALLLGVRGEWAMRHGVDACSVAGRSDCRGNTECQRIGGHGVVL